MNAFLRTPLSLAVGAATALALLSLPLRAEEPGRFVLKETDQNSFIRLDTHTGAVSHCSSSVGEWSCKSVKDDRAELHEEIAKLRKENAELKTRLAGARETAPEAPLALPSEADLDRIMTLLEKYLERFLSFIRKFEQQREDEAI
jgi:hypothetical protein